MFLLVPALPVVHEKVQNKDNKRKMREKAERCFRNTASKISQMEKSDGFITDSACELLNLQKYERVELPSARRKGTEKQEIVAPIGRSLLAKLHFQSQEKQHDI